MPFGRLSGVTAYLATLSSSEPSRQIAAANVAADLPANVATPAVRGGVPVCAAATATSPVAIASASILRPTSVCPIRRESACP